MIPVTTFAGQQVALFGLGGSGLLAARALQDGGADVVAFDDDAQKIAEARAAGIKTQDLRNLDWTKTAALVLAPGVPLTHPQPHWTVDLARKADVEVIGDIELFCRERAKSARRVRSSPSPAPTANRRRRRWSRTSLRGAGIDAQIGGNIGVPRSCACAAQAGPRVTSSRFRPIRSILRLRCDPTVGILLNVTEDHLDRHGTMERYAAIKERLPADVEKNGTAVIDIDDAYTRAAADRIQRSGKNVVRVSVESSLRDGYFAQESRIMRAVGGKAQAVADLAGIGSLRGTHNAQNAACAVAACVALGVDLPAIQKGLASFPGLAHRMQQVGRKGNVLFVNDSKATNADSAAKALASFNDIYWIAGGKPKTGGIEGLAEFFPRIRKAYLIGEAAKEFAQTLEGRVPYEIAGCFRLRSTRRPAMPRLRGSTSRSCCFHRPAPLSTSTAILKCAAKPSPTSCWQYPAMTATVNAS